MLFSQDKLKKGINLKSGLSIIIVGCGAVGTTLVEQLNEENHDITVIDTNPDVIAEITNLYDVMGICGNGASFSVQKEAGIKDADLIIAVTKSDELNLLCCTVAGRVANCAAIARVRNPEYSHELEHIKSKLGLAMIINPESEASLEMYRLLCLPTALEVSTFAGGKVELVKIRVPKDNKLDGITIAELGRMVDNVLINAVERKNEIFIPKGDFRIEAGDAISFIAPTKYVSNFLSTVGFKTHKVKNAMIIGGGDAGYYLAKRLLNADISVKLIEKNKARCEELAALLPKAVIINGDGTDEDLLIEEGIYSTEAFIPLTGSDEENILLSLHAKQISSAKLITKVGRISFKDAINSLDLGSIVYPKYITSEAIIAYVRAKSENVNSNIESLFHIFDHRVEAIEFNVAKDSKVTNTQLKDLHLRDNLLVCSIFRNGKIIIPSGSDMILAGDRVIIVTSHKGLKDISNIVDKG